MVWMGSLRRLYTQEKQEINKLKEMEVAVGLLSGIEGPAIAEYLEARWGNAG
jgi:hypothetical protein